MSIRGCTTVQSIIILIRYRYSNQEGRGGGKINYGMNQSIWWGEEGKCIENYITRIETRSEEQQNWPPKIVELADENSKFALDPFYSWLYVHCAIRHRPCVFEREFTLNMTSSLSITVFQLASLRQQYQQYRYVAIAERYQTTVLQLAIRAIVLAILASNTASTTTTTSSTSTSQY